MHHLASYIFPKMKKTASLFARLTVVFTLLVAMTSTSWAHRVAPVPFDDGLSAYLAAGGTLADLCADQSDADHAAGQTCDACRLVDAAALPPVTFACTGALSVTLVQTRPVAGTSAIATIADPSRPVRAPPAV